MKSSTLVYKSIVGDLITAGKESSYPADANEPDPRYKSYGVRAAGKKQIISTHRAAINKLPTQEQIKLATMLMESEYGEQQSVALYVLERAISYFTPDKFNELDQLMRHVHGWSKVDSFTGSLLRDLLFHYPEPFMKIVRQWNNDEDLWLRRASIVLFTRKVARSGQFNDVALDLCNNLIHDSEDMVQKGVGWALKDLMHSDKPRIISYVKELRAQGVTSVITLYAIRNIKGAERVAILDI